MNETSGELIKGLLVVVLLLLETSQMIPKRSLSNAAPYKSSFTQVLLRFWKITQILCIKCAFEQGQVLLELYSSIKHVY